MGVGWADIAVTSTGQMVMCSCSSSTASVTFGSVVQPLPEPGRDIRVCSGFGHVYAIVKGQHTGNALVIRDDGLRATLGPTSGNQCVGLLPTPTDLLAVYVTSATEYVHYTLLPAVIPASSVSRPIPPSIVGTSQGFLDLLPDGTPVWTDLHRTTTLPNGVTLVLWMQRGPWVIGQGLVAPAQVSAWDGTKMFTVWQGDTSFPPRLAWNGSQVMAGIATSTPIFVAGPFGPYVVNPPEIVKIDRPCYLGWFLFGKPTTAPQNCTLPIGSAKAYVTRVDGAHVARFISVVPDSDLDLLERAIAEVQAEEPTIPALPYWTAQAQQSRVPRGTQDIGVEAYRHVGESLTTFESRVRAACDRCLKPWLIAQVYTSNSSNTDDLASLVPVYARIARDMPKVQGILGFSGSGRPTGYQDHPDVHASWTTLAAGIPSAPPPPLPRAVSTGGVILMATTALTGFLQHYGINKLSNGQVTLNANAAGEVISIQPNGTIQTRPKGTDGGYERGNLDGQIFSVNPGTIYSFVVANVTGL